MLESLLMLFIAGCSLALYGYWLCWACLLVIKDGDAFVQALNWEYERIRSWKDTSRFGARLFQRLDHHALTIWYGVDRPRWGSFSGAPGEDVISALGRFGFLGGEELSWILPGQKARRAKA